MVVIRGAAEILSMALTALVAVWLSRTVGADGLGYFAVTQAILRIGGVFAGGGFATVGAQRVAHGADSPSLAWSVVTSARLALALAALVLVESAVAIAPIGDANLRQLIQYTAPAWLVLAISSEWLLVARGQVLAVSVSRVFAGLGAAAAATLLVRDGDDMSALAVVIVTPLLVAAIFTMWLAVRPQVDSSPVRVPRWSLIRDYSSDAWQYLKADVSVVISNSVDRIFLYVVATPAVVGQYEAAYKLTQPFFAIAGVVNDSMFRRLADALTAPEKSPQTLRAWADLMFVATVPLGLFLILFAEPIVSVVYGQGFDESATYLAILGWAITIGYLGAAVSIPFMAWRRPREYANALVTGNVTNVLGNVLLVPPFLATGAAVATVVAKCAIAIVGYLGFRSCSRYPIISDFSAYAAMSAVAFTAGAVSELWIKTPSLVSAAVFLAIYVLLALVRWRRSVRRPSGAATLASDNAFDQDRLTQ